MSNSTSTIRYVLDTDIVTHQQLDHEVVIAKLRQVDRSGVATTVISMYEQLRGRLAAINRKQPDTQLQLALQRLEETHAYYCTAQLLSFDDAAVQVHNSLLTQKLRIGAQDLKIAAIVLAHDAVLVTTNARHFKLVPTLQIEDWTQS